MSLSTDAVDALLQPISDDQPAGPDLRYTPEFDKLQAQRRSAVEKGTELSAWQLLGDNAVDMLQKSKDLRIAICVVESWTRLEGFRGAAEGLTLLRRLIEDFWNSLYPAIDPEDSEPLAARSGPLDWVSGMGGGSRANVLPQLLKTLPLSSVPQYGVLHYEVTQMTGAAKQAVYEEGNWPTSDDIDRALRSTPPVHLDKRLNDIIACEEAAEALEAACDVRFIDRGSPMISYRPLREVLETARYLIERTVKNGAAAGEASAQPAGGGDASQFQAAAVDSYATVSYDTVWQQANALVVEGRTDGLRVAQQHLSAAPFGREAFLRQLGLAELCIQAGVHALAFPLVDELARTSDERKLDEWEDPAVLRRMWQALADCCRELQSYKPWLAERLSEAENRLGVVPQENATEGEGEY